MFLRYPKTIGSDCEINVFFDYKRKISVSLNDQGSVVEFTLDDLLLVFKEILKINNYVKQNHNFYCHYCHEIFHISDYTPKIHEGKTYHGHCLEDFKSRGEGYKYPCLKCNQHRIDYYSENKNCELCGGKGYTKEEYEKVTRYEIKN